MVTYSAAVLNELEPTSFVETARAVDRDLAYENLFVADERFYRNTYAQLALAAEHTESVGLATGVTNPYTRNPALTAAAIASVDEAADGRAFLGLGAGSPMALDQVGIEHDNPIGAVKDAITAIRRLQAGESVTAACEAFELRDLSLDFEPARTVPVYVAGRGPQILALGGHVGDGVVAGAGLASVDGMTYARERIAAGAARGDRALDDLDVICWAFLSMADDQAVAVDAVAPLTAKIVQAVPTETLTAIGVSRADAERVKALDDVANVPRARLREAVSRDLVEQFAIAGTPERCRDHVAALHAVGVDHVAVLGFGNEANGIRRNLEMFSRRVADVISDD